jgi:hypothetical protein
MNIAIPFRRTIDVQTLIDVYFLQDALCTLFHVVASKIHSEYIAGRKMQEIIRPHPPFQA